MSDDRTYNVTVTGGQGVLVGDGTQNNYYGTVIQIALQNGQDVAQVVAQLTRPAMSTSERLWNVPFPPNPFFIGREEVLAQLGHALAETKKAALTSGQGQAISGLGGVGKTQTAVEYAYRHRQEYRAVFWVQAETAVTLDGAFGRIAALLDLPEKDTLEIEKTREAVKRWLATESDYLLILDNAEDQNVLSAYLPPHPTGHLLLTSRSRSFGKINLPNPLRLPVLSPVEAVAFLLQRTDRAGADEAERASASALAEELGCLPLALEQAGAYMVEKQASFQSYRTSYGHRTLALLEAQGPETGGYEKTVATTWSLNFEAVRQESAAAAEVLRVSAFLAPDRIPEELLRDGAAELGAEIADALQDVATDPLLLDELLTVLSRYSLIQRDVTAHTYDIHRLVQAVIKDRMDEPTRRAYAERVVRVLNAVFPSAEYSTWPLCERLLPHALLCADQIEAYRFAFAEAARLLNQAGYYLAGQAQYAEAEPLYKRSLAIRETTQEPQHSNLALSLNNLANLYSDQGKYTEAEPLYKRALEIREATLGAQHPDTALSLNNLAALYDHQGKYVQAEALYERALTIREKVLGAGHPDTGVGLNNLAGVYSRQGKYAKAEPMYKRALAIREKALGPDHPDTAHSLINLAGVYKDQGRYEQAEPMLKRALKIYEEALGSEHPDIASGLNNLAFLYTKQNRHAEAELPYKRALEIVEKVLGPDHPDTASSLNNLAGLYIDQNKYAEAEPLYKRALAIRETMLGPDHPDTALSLNNLAFLYDCQGKYTEADPLLKRALEIYENVLGTEHPETVIIRENYRLFQQNYRLFQQQIQQKADPL